MEKKYKVLKAAVVWNPRKENNSLKKNTRWKEIVSITERIAGDC